jgi:undecaprenyl-diphosphatase
MTNEEDQVTEKVKGISVRVIIILAVLAIFLAGLYFLTDEIVLDGETAFDDRVYKVFQDFQTPAITNGMLFFTFFGSFKFLMPAYVLLSLYFIFFKRNTVRSFNIAAIGLSSGLLLQFIKRIFQRHRPPHPLIENVGGFSYPSGHSFSSFTFAGVLIYMLWKSQAKLLWKWMGTVALFIFAVLIAASRVYLHVHYPSDVLAGFFLSFVWLTICIYLLSKITKKGAVTAGTANN